MRKMNKHLSIHEDVTDRGKIKWSSMMLPEHVGLMREVKREAHHDEQPQLFEEDWELMAQEVERAYYGQLTIRLKTYENGRVKEHLGKIVKVAESTLTYEDPFGEWTISLKTMIGAEVE